MRISREPGRVTRFSWPKADLDVPQVVDQVGQDDDVEGLASMQVERVRVGLDEVQLRVPSRGAAQHRARKIHAQAERRLQRGQQVALATADLEHALVRGDQRAIHLGQARVIGARPVRGAREAGRDVVPVACRARV